MLLWAGQGVSTTGAVVSGIAFPLLILSLTHSPTQAGLVGGLERLPFAVFGLVAGAIVDRWSRKWVMIVCDTGRALTLASIPIALASGHLTVVQLYVVAVAEGTLFVSFDVARVACLPSVVPKQQLGVATAQNEASYAVAALAGPPLGGLLYQITRSLPFLADALSYSASVVSLFLIRVEFQESAIRAANARPRLTTEIAGGLSWLWGRPILRLLAFVGTGINLAFSAAGLILIVLIQRHHGSPATIGLIFGGAAVGGVIGSIIGGQVQGRINVGLAVLGAVWLLALLWPLFAVAPNVFVLGLVAAALYVVSPILQVAHFSYRLSLIPPELQGRVNSVFRLLAFSGQPVGQALSGFLLQKFGPTSAVLVVSAFLLIVAVLVSASGRVRSAARAAG